MSPLRHRPVAVTAALVLSLAACGGGGARQTLERVSSAAATAALAAGELRARHTSGRYTTSTLEVLRRAVDRDAGSLRPDELPPAARDQALAAVALTRRALAAMDSALHHRDTIALAAAARGADAAAHTLRAVADRLPVR
jgi:hypothetical protein